MTDWRFGAITVRHGTPARREIEVTWNDKSPRDLSGLTGYFRVYQTAGGTELLFPEVQLADGDAAHKRVLNLTSAQTTQTGTAYYAEVEFRDGGGSVAADAGWYGQITIKGR